MTRRHRALRPRAALAAVGLAALACATGPEKTTPHLEAAPEPHLARGRGYGPEPEATPSALERSALEALQRRLGRGTPKSSAALALAARELARGAAEGAGDPLGRSRVRHALTAALSYDPAPAAHLVIADAAAAPEAVAESLSRPGDATHLGIGAEVRGGRAFVVALAARRAAALDAFPRDVEVGATARLRGSLSGLAQPAVFVTTPAGEARPLLARVEGRSFEAPVRFDARGRWVIEVTGEGPHGPEVAALLVVSSGGAALAEPPRPGDDREPSEGRAAEARVSAALNETRRRSGLPPLEPWPELAEVARRHSEAMLAAGMLAHRLPASPDAGERLRRARLPYARVLENVARAPTALAAHRMVEESPAHRHNVLSREVTRLGCGIARGTLPGGEPLVYLTELFVEPVQDGSGDRLTPEARVREALWRERARLGAPPLQADPVLDALAREAARDMLREREPAAHRLAEQALRERRKLAAADAFVASRAADATRSKNLADHSFRRVGVGVTVGDDPRLGSGLLWIAVIYTD